MPFHFHRQIKSMSFVQEIRTFLRLLGILGWIPARMDRADRGKLTLKLGPVEKAYSLVMIAIQVGIFLPALNQNAESFVSAAEDTLIVSTMKLSITVIATGIPASVWSQARSFVEFINGITEVEEILGEVNSCDIELNLKLQRFGLIAIFISLTPYFGILVLKRVFFGPLRNPLWHLVVCICFSNNTMTILMFVCVTRAIGNLSDVVLQSYRVLCCEVKMTPLCKLKRQAAFREVWVKLQLLLLSTGNTSYIAFFLPLIGSLITIIFCIYLLSSGLPAREALAFVCLLFTFTTSIIVLMAENANFCIKKVAYTFEKAIDLTKMPPRNDEETLKLLARMLRMEAPITLNGYLDVDRRLYTKFVPELVSIWIMLIQLNIKVRPVYIQDFFE